MKTLRFIAIATLFGASVFTTATLLAQPQSVSAPKRIDLQRHDLSIPGREIVQARVEIGLGQTAPRHWHPGEEIVYVIEGTLEYRIDGQPPVTVRAGEVYFVPARAVHTAKTIGDAPAAELATYIVEKGQPLLVLADSP